MNIRDAGFRLGQGFEAALFDLDGTLVDTMPLHFRAYRDVLAECGIEIDFDFFMSVSGGPARDTIPRLVNGRPCDISTDEIHRRKVVRARQLIEESAPDQLPCSLLLHLLPARIPVGLVSSGSRASVTATLASLGWESVFKVVVCGDDVAHGKPSPEGYLKAAATLGVQPEKCIVFEDMSDGVTAATSAGMRVFDLRKALPAWRSEPRLGLTA